MDDILIIGNVGGATLNPEKCEIGKTKLTFLGHVIDSNGIRPDPEKTEAIAKMSPPKSVSELRRLMGMINQLGKFTPNLAEMTQPLHELLSKKRTWMWGPAQTKAFNQVKQELARPITLALYDLIAETKISADASSHGLGAVLMQKVNEVWNPIAYASRSMSEAEKRYAQIEKEALATTWACEKFSAFILGKCIEIEIDHQPLVPLLGAKHLDSLPPRVLRFRLRLDCFNYNIQHIQGKALYTADTLSRAPIDHPTSAHSVILQELAELNANSTTAHIPASTRRLDIYRRAQSDDPICQLLFQYCQNGWPHKKDINPGMTPYWEVQGELSIVDRLLLHGSRIVVPKSLQKEILEKLHEGHLGIHDVASELEQQCGGQACPNKSRNLSRSVQNASVRTSQARNHLFPVNSQTTLGKK